MLKLVTSLALVAAPALFLTACGGAAPAPDNAPASQATAPASQAAAPAAPAKHACAACTKGKSGETIWCEKCGHGFLAGKKMGCKACFDGKSGTNTWCEKCGHGFVDGMDGTLVNPVTDQFDSCLA